MGAIKEIAFAFCAAAIISAAVGLLCGNRLQKSMRYIISLTLICTVISVAVGKKFTFFSSEPSQNNISYNEMPLYEYQAEYLVADILKKEGIKFENITAKATKNEDGSIVINELEISGCKSREKAINTLSGMGIDCNIRVVE